MTIPLTLPVFRFAPSPTVNTPRTPSEVEAEKAMAKERERRFMADTSAWWTSLNIYGDENNIIAADRKESAVVKIAAFEEVFEAKKKEKGGSGGTRRGRK